SSAATVLTKLDANAAAKQAAVQKVMQDTSVRIFEITQDVTVNKARTADKVFNQMANYVTKDACQSPCSDFLYQDWLGLAPPKGYHGARPASQQDPLGDCLPPGLTAVRGTCYLVLDAFSKCPNGAFRQAFVCVAAGVKKPKSLAIGPAPPAQFAS